MKTLTEEAKRHGFYPVTANNVDDTARRTNQKRLTVTEDEWICITEFCESNGHKRFDKAGDSIKLLGKVVLQRRI